MAQPRWRAGWSCAPWRDAEGLFTPGTDYLVAADETAMARHLRDLRHDPDLRAARRAGKLSTKEDVFTGKVYNGADAKKHGLVDAIGSLQDAVNKAAQLARAGQGGNSASDFTQNFNNAWQQNSPAS